MDAADAAEENTQDERSVKMKEQILAHLRKEKIKLWLEPYCNASGSSVHDEIQALSESLAVKLTLTDDTGTSSGSREQIATHLVDLQSHALQRLREKNALGIRLVASKQHMDGVPPNGVAPALSSWGQAITEESKGNSLHLQIRGMDAKLTPSKMTDDVCRVLDAKSVRLIWKGKTIACDDATPIVKLTSGKQIEGCKTKTAKTVELLCIVSGYGYSPPSPQTDAVTPDQPSSAPIDPASAPRTDRSIIQSIKTAATKLQFSSSGFEITDQRGQLVSMSRTDSVSFLVALGMHRLARSRIQESQESQKREHIASALVFLLEADQEWENSSVLQNWKSVVDNYGLLQLDIAWCYLLLESLDDLNDALRRLDAAEGCLKKQVHSNFVTLAVAQAEMGNPIPPLCAVFVRLFLLQGVASRLQGRSETSREKMEMSRVLCGRLRESSPSESVEALAGACWVDPATAISALRRGNGELDRAADIIAADNKEEREATLKRRRQHRVGKCANGDYCNVDLASSIAALIGFDDVNLEGLLHEDDDNEDELSTSAQLVIGLLRLSNNDVNVALELFNNTGAEEVIVRANRLGGGRAKAKKPRVDKKKNHEVRDMDLASLVSMGVESVQARRALEATGNVDAAILWISADDGKPGEDKPGDNSCSSKEQHPPRETLLEAELGEALGSDSKQQLEKEWLGLSLDQEWDLIEKYN
ncbi:hypothetical protein THAOC_34807 [Thalassiosira oceanica]|uniref:UBA domain-containing protein n=1 Tax=Thalassiosira oceanica TaxID=159749 RepID=K0RIL5_THAOC|nr:hypothetical protein THAOC_34807 [Thalassiosira oceanica]|eukprot:EJK46522.1 hypothetical protein THAOC_34807 [Thalassiosira oceanica]